MRKEPTSELYQWALVYMKLVNTMFAVIDLLLFFVLLSIQ